MNITKQELKEMMPDTTFISILLLILVITQCGTNTKITNIEHEITTIRQTLGE